MVVSAFEYQMRCPNGLSLASRPQTAVGGRHFFAHGAADRARTGRERSRRPDPLTLNSKLRDSPERVHLWTDANTIQRERAESTTRPVVWRGSGGDGMSLFPMVSTRGFGRVGRAVTSEKAVDGGKNKINVGIQ